jgi:hypothetical protein
VHILRVTLALKCEILLEKLAGTTTLAYFVSSSVKTKQSNISTTSDNPIKNLGKVDHFNEL